MATHKEDLAINPFYSALFTQQADLFRNAAERLEKGLLLVPCASSLTERKWEKFFFESHLMEPAYIPGTFCNWRGQAVEVKADRVITSLGFKEQRVCTVLQQDSVFEFGRSIKILVIDRPLIGNFAPPADPSERQRASLHAGGGPCEWLAAAPLVESDFFDSLSKFRKTFLLVEGFENAFAQRITELSQTASLALIKYSKNLESQRSQIENDVERAAYATLHAWIFPHIMSTSRLRDEEVKAKISMLPADDVLLALMQAPNELIAGTKRLVAFCESRLIGSLKAVDTIISPHQKLSAFARVLEMLSQGISEACKGVQVSGEHLVPAFAILIRHANLNVFYAHIVHVEMLLGVHANSLALGQGAYALSTFQSAIEFLTQLKRQAGRSIARETVILDDPTSSALESLMKSRKSPQVA